MCYAYAYMHMLCVYVIYKIHFYEHIHLHFSYLQLLCCFLDSSFGSKKKKTCNEHREIQSSFPIFEYSNLHPVLPYLNPSQQAVSL